MLWSSAADGGWRPLLPELPLEAPLYPASARTTELSWQDSGADAYRVLIRDNASDGLLLKLPVRGTSYIVDWSRLPAPAHYRWRLQTWDVDTATWQDLDPYAPLPEPARIESAGPAEGSGPGEPRVLLLFTVDTEATLQYMSDPDPRRAVEEFIFGRHPDGEAGIEMIMDALERHGFKGTFFLDVLCEYQFGEGTLEPVVDAIKRRGHDIQLHMHTAPHLRFARDPELVSLSDAWRQYDADKFRAALELAIGLFVERVGEEPVAYRSGAYRVSDEFLRILPEFGLRIDSSIYAFKNCEVSSWMRARTQPFRVGSLLEIPVSWRLEWRGSGPVPMQFAPYRQGGDENRSFTRLPAPTDGPPSTLVYLGHSYQYRMRGPDIGSEAVTRWRETLEGRLPAPRAQRLIRSDRATMVLRRAGRQPDRPARAEPARACRSRRRRGSDDARDLGRADRHMGRSGRPDRPGTGVARRWRPVTPDGNARLLARLPAPSGVRATGAPSSWRAGYHALRVVGGPVNGAGEGGQDWRGSRPFRWCTTRQYRAERN